MEIGAERIGYLPQFPALHHCDKYCRVAHYPEFTGRSFFKLQVGILLLWCVQIGRYEFRRETIPSTEYTEFQIQYHTKLRIKHRPCMTEKLIDRGGRIKGWTPKSRYPYRVSNYAPTNSISYKRISLSASHYAIEIKIMFHAEGDG